MKTVEHRGQTLRYIEVTSEDIAIANRLAHEVLGRTLDELPPQTRRLLGLLDAMVTDGVRTAGARPRARCASRGGRCASATGWGDTQLKVHLGRLVELEYVLVHRGRQGQGYVYELVYARRGRGRAAFLPGLVDADCARRATDYESAATSRAVAATRGRSVGPVGCGGWSGADAAGPRSIEGDRSSRKAARFVIARTRSVAKRASGNGKSTRVVARARASLLRASAVMPRHGAARTAKAAAAIGDASDAEGLYAWMRATSSRCG